jgi:hypothetical protein
MKSISFSVLKHGLIALFGAFLLISFQANAQTCGPHPAPGNAGFHLAGGFGGCAMAVDITYDCGGMVTTTTCVLDAGGEGFDLPAGCCLLRIVIHTPYQGAIVIDPNIPIQNIPVPSSGLPFPMGPWPCDQHEITMIDAHFPMGPCDVGDIHIN